MHLQVICRPQLAGRAPRPGLCMLAEGDWPDDRTDGRRLLSLNELGDARFGWIDGEAEALCGRLVAAATSTGPSYQAVPLVPLFTLGLRYYLVKLLRFRVLLETVIRQHGVRRADLLGEPQRDADYVVLFDSVVRRLSVDGRLQFCLPDQPKTCVSPAIGERIRRLASRVAASVVPPPGRPVADARFVFLCGDPKVFDPLEVRLVAEGRWQVGRVWERSPSVARRRAACRALEAKTFRRMWLRGGRAGALSGARVLECRGDSDPFYGYLARRLAAEISVPPRLLSFRGTPLGPLVGRWLMRQVRRAAPLLEAIDGLEEHFARYEPQWLLVDEDATPFKRAAVAVARRHGANTAVVQHGVPFVSFGFAPLEADWLCAWGESSREQFMGWKVPTERIVLSGSPKLEETLPRNSGGDQTARPSNDAEIRTRASSRTVISQRPVSGRLLLLATPHHTDDRPDVLRFHLTPRTNAELIRAALSALEALPGWRLVIKLHPRERDPRFFRRIVAAAGDVRRRVRISRHGPLRRLVERATVVLSCASTAGVEALVYGRPVIQLMPRGSADLIDADRWGLAGTARGPEELIPLLADVRSGRHKPDPGVLTRNFADLGTSAARRIAEFLERPPEAGRVSHTSGDSFASHRRSIAAAPPGREPEPRPTAVTESRSR